MSEIPSFFNYLKSEGDKSGLYPFAYVNEDKAFSIGDGKVALTDFDPYTFSSDELGLGDGIDIDEMPQQAALISIMGGVIIGPKLHEWVEANPKVLADTYKVMYEAYVAFLDDLSQVPAERTTSHMGFASGLREYGGIGLQVLGNCACMGPNPQSYYIDGQFEHGFGEYDLHNADSQVQRASLYAGLGHLAQLTTSTA
ncbi:MAG: hypothetical protein HKL80_06565 [Acidimicrobiales bacterium]|nr:hypothetical protein [Acidimicrobiales bacterium]